MKLPSLGQICFLKCRIDLLSIQLMLRRNEILKMQIWSCYWAFKNSSGLSLPKWDYKALHGWPCPHLLLCASPANSDPPLLRLCFGRIIFFYFLNIFFEETILSVRRLFSLEVGPPPHTHTPVLSTPAYEESGFGVPLFQWAFQEVTSSTF